MTRAVDSLSDAHRAQIDLLVAHYQTNLHAKAERLAGALFELVGAHLTGAVHSLRRRAKDPEL